MNKVAIAQINPKLGDFEGNCQKILKYVRQAVEQNVDMIVFPECSIFGYHPFDMLERAEVVREQVKAFERLAKKIPKGIAVIVGIMTFNKEKKGRPYYNSAALLVAGKKPQLFHKQLLPTGDVFDEARFIECGSMADNFFSYKSKNCVLTICEDIWAWPDKKGHSIYKENPIVKLKNKNIDFVVNLSASPFYPDKDKKRHELVAATAGHFKAPMVYVNMVGAQDEIIYDGQSFAVDAKGKIIARAKAFEEDFLVLELPQKKKVAKQVRSRVEKRNADRIDVVKRALILGIRDYCEKTGFKQIHMGLSGGIDSALVGCLAVEALGKENVKFFALPGPFTDARSTESARELAKNLGSHFEEISISSLYETAKSVIESSLHINQFGLVHENLQARLRGLVLMAFSNQQRSLLVATSNKSELAAGYSTLYGDMCGGLAPIGDLTKTEVYKMAEAYAENIPGGVIPRFIIDRAPTAELRPNQKDQDSLPPYDELDAAVTTIVEHCAHATTPAAKWLLPIIMRTEFKRWQAPPVLKVSKHGFGRGRRWPIAQSL